MTNNLRNTGDCWEILLPHAGSMFACPEGILLDDVAEEAGGFRCLFFQTMFQLTVGEHKETLMPSSLTTQNGV